jgi:hypothetical protein
MLELLRLVRICKYLNRKRSNCTAGQTLYPLVILSEAKDPLYQGAHLRHAVVFVAKVGYPIPTTQARTEKLSILKLCNRARLHRLRKNSVLR